MNHNDSLLDVLQNIFRHKKLLIRVAMIAFFGSIIISLLLPVYYKSTTVFYAASPDLANPDKMFGTGNTDLKYYGSGDDIDRILTIAKRNEVLEYLIDEFKLYEHYDIDSTTKKAAYNIQMHFDGLFEVTKTKYDAIELSVEDKDPKIAAAITNAAREKIEEVLHRLIKNSQGEQLNIYTKSIESSKKYIKTLGDSLQRIRSHYGIYNTESQSETLSELLAKAQTNVVKYKSKLEATQGSKYARRDSILSLKANIKASEEQLKSLNTELARFNTGMSYVQTLEEQHEKARIQLSYDMERSKHVRVAHESDVLVIHLVEDGQVPIVKERPKRAVIVLGVTFLALLFTILGILISNNYKHVNWDSILNRKDELKS